MKVVLLGAPGCGKGTQASKIAEEYNLPHISTGDIFRENISGKTELGLKVKAIIDSGNLCPDDVTCDLVKDRLSKPDCQNGYLLDGFPRNLVQARALEDFAKPDVVIDIDVDLDLIEKRITGRRSCPKCGGSFHIDFLSNDKMCPTCGGDLTIRKDDTPEVIKERLTVYKNSTAPLIDFYKSNGVLKVVDGNNTIDAVFEQIKKVLG
ncbi:MAG: adenylate kinase [Clostridia bacterium]|nr:adenylate kinase [Clostridia bacterium]